MSTSFNSFWNFSNSPVKATNLHTKKDGSLINIENDVIGKYVEKLMKPRENEVAESRITMDFLLKNGF